ncbi:MAG: helix-turn-helix domain-containing protein [Muribaculaceae bacterium]|nr:helix-turn-helix domain-containing protein [Muribaculaceae bacterium]
MIEDSIAFRLKHLIDIEGLTSSQFADRCKIPRPTLSQLLTGRNKKISDVLLGQIHSSFPDINILWLLFGEGDIKVSKGSSEQSLSHTSNGTPSLEDNLGLFSFADKNSGTNPYNNPNSSTDYKEEFKYSNLTPLTKESNDIEPLKNELIVAKNRIKELESEIDKILRNPRKVVQIMVYYDDSTFETFIPRSNQ